MNNSPAGERPRSGPAGHGCVKRGSEKYTNLLGNRSEPWLFHEK